jgi:hypothetical protein
MFELIRIGIRGHIFVKIPDGDMWQGPIYTLTKTGVPLNVGLLAPQGKDLSN